MPYDIQCTDSDCGKVTSVDDIYDLIYRHLSKDGWIECPVCGGRGFIDSWNEGWRSFRQEKSDTGSKLYLKAIIKLNRLPTTNDADSMPRNFVFLVSYRKDAPPDHIWPVRYYKGGDDQWRVSLRGPLLSLREVGNMMDHLERPDGEWGLGLHVPRNYKGST